MFWEKVFIFFHKNIILGKSQLWVFCHFESIEIERQHNYLFKTNCSSNNLESKAEKINGYLESFHLDPLNLHLLQMKLIL